jgi:outer membrane lipoprotein-sorting protein
MRKRMLAAGVGLAATVFGFGLFRVATAQPALTGVDATVERMANAIDHYNSVEATFVRNDYSAGNPITVTGDVSIQVKPAPGARAELTLEDGTKLTQVNDGSKLLEHGNGRYRLTNVPPVSKEAVTPTKERLGVKNGKMGVAYRKAPAWVSAGGMADALFPQQEALALIKRSASTEIEGTEQILGRATEVLKVVASAVHRDQFDTVKFWVDKETGILMKQEYWKDGKLLSDQTAVKLTVNSAPDAAKFRVVVPTNAAEEVAG